MVSSNLAHKTTVEVLDLLSDVHYGLEISIGVGDIYGRMNLYLDSNLKRQTGKNSNMN